MGPANIQLQGTALDLLQALVSRGDADLLTLDNAEAAIISKLYASIHADRFDLQNKLLHVLHSVIVASAEAQAEMRHRARRASEPSPLADDGSATMDSRRPGTALASKKVNPLLVQTLTDGISKNAKRPTLQHWIDFVLMTVPQSQSSFSVLVFPLSNCICRQLRLGLDDIVQVSTAINGLGNLESSTTDAEFITLMNALERLVLIGLTKSETESIEDDTVGQEKLTVEPVGLLGLVSTVFSPEAPNFPEEQLNVRIAVWLESRAMLTHSPRQTRSPNYRCLEEAVQVLYSIWVLTNTTMLTSSSVSSNESYSLIFSRVRLRCRKALERLFRAQSGEVMECIVECWHGSDDASVSPEPTEGILRFIVEALYQDSPTATNATFEIVDILSASAQTVVHMLCESISHRAMPTPERSKRLAINNSLYVKTGHWVPNRS